MIKPTISIKGKTTPAIKIKGKTNASIIRIYPELENLEITPTLEDQKFKSEMYGFDEVNVKGVNAYIDEDIKPEYIKEGVDILGVVGNVVELKGEEKVITPKTTTQTIIPSDGKNGITKITVQPVDRTIDEDIKPENIIDGVEILGVVGNYKGIDTSDATVTPDKVLAGTTVYINNEKIEGTLPNNGELEFTPSDELQIVPEGYTSGGIVSAADITALNEYNACLTLANSIEDLEDYNDTTATPEDVLKDKIFYANGERQTGTLEVTSGGELEASFISLLSSERGVNCTKIPSNLTSIGMNAFIGCSNLALTELPESVTSIESYAFQDCTNLKFKELPNKVQTIGNNTFNRCTNFELEKLPNDLVSIGSYAFGSCTKLAIKEMGNNLTTIGKYAFQKCTNITLTKLSDKLTKIEDYVFEGCSNLALTELPSGITSIGYSSFDGCSDIALTELPEGLTSIGNYAFRGCGKLEIIKLPESVNTLYAGAFMSCGIKTLEVPAGITALSSYIFRYCSLLSEITFKGAITTMQNYFFESCTSLTKVVFSNVTAVPGLSNKNAFTNTPIASGTGYIYVPDELVDSFKSATNWSSYADQIKGVSELV